MRWDGWQLHSARPRVVNEAAVRAASGVVAIALRGHFVGVVAESAAAARRAAEQLEIDWRFDIGRRPPSAVTPAASASSGAMASPDMAPASGPAPEVGPDAHATLDSGASPGAVESPGTAAPQPTRHGGAQRAAVDAALGRAFMRVTHSYGWPAGNLGRPNGYRGSPAADAECRGIALADVRPGAATIWTAAQAPALRADLAVLLDLPPQTITLLPAPCGAADAAAAAANQSASQHAAADAALMSQIVGRPVQVELSAADLCIEGDAAGRIVNRIDGGVDAVGTMNVYRVATQYPELLATPLALLLTGAAPARRNAAAPADPTGSLPPPYEFAHLDLTVSSNPGATAAFDFSDCIAAQVFAYESHIDETAVAIGCDPVQWRLRHLRDARGAALLQRTAERAQWPAERPPAPRGSTAGGGVRRGRGFAYARTVDCRVGPPQRSWSAWVADVEVDALSGDVAVTRVVVGHEAAAIGGDADQRMPLADEREPALRITAAPLRERARAAISQLITERRFDSAWPSPSAAGSARGDRGITATPAPATAIDVMCAIGAEPVPLAVGPAAMLPAAAAIANAIYAATGVRLREPPFSPERVRRALDDLRAPRSGRLRTWATENGATPIGAAPIGAAPIGAAPIGAAPIGAAPIGAARTWAIGALSGLAGALALVSPWRGSIAPVAPPDPGYFSAAAIERGRLVSAAADCAVCHTAPLGAPYAGGLELPTPFGKIVSTNITPDADTGIGRWSYAAFERALRSGIHRDGRHLYPAFPYTAYAKLTDGDLLALYAYLMSRAPVRAAPARTRLKFPLNWRPLMAAWNLMFHRPGVFMPEPSRSLEWNRGAYLVDALGHCSACHSPRNVFGAERRGRDYLAGGVVDGWEAPALNPSSPAPRTWTREDFYDYLRSGYSANHGAAAGPMSAVVTELGALPDADLRAIATYLASLNPAPRPAAGVNAAAANAAEIPGSTVPDAAAQHAATVNDAAATHGRTVAAAAAVHGRSANAAALDGLGARIYGGACAVCHEPDQGPPIYGVKVALAPTTTLHAANPTNLIRVLLEGIANPPYPELGHMPAFHDTLDDRQVAELADYLRARFAPGEPSWRNVAQTVAALRSTGGVP
jgi:nicotinate dehydrogenase subunit B